MATVDAQQSLHSLLITELYSITGVSAIQHGGFFGFLTSQFKLYIVLTTDHQCKRQIPSQ